MGQKRFWIWIIAVILSLALSGIASAVGQDWQVAFDPRDYGFGPVDWSYGAGGYLSTTEVFKENLYIVVNSFGEGWTDPNHVKLGGKIIRSPDGANWEAVTPAGFGFNNIGSWDMKAFGDELYVSLFALFPEEPGVIMRSADGIHWEAVSNSWEGGLIRVPDKVGVFKGMIYISAFKEPFWGGSYGPAELWRSPTGDPGTWEKVREFGDATWHTNGLDIYKGMLYMSVQDDSGPITIWRSPDGLNWQEVVSDGFQNISPYEGVKNGGDFAIHQDWLYFSNGPDILRTKNGTDWEMVMEGGFGNPGNFQIYAMGSYLGSLYAVANNLGGVEAWMSPSGDPGTWVQISESAFGSSETWFNQLAYEATVFKGDLYVGTDSYDWLGMLWKLPNP